MKIKAKKKLMKFLSHRHWIFSDNNKSIIVFVAKNAISGINIFKRESRLSNNNSPSLLKIEKTASAKNTIW